MATVGTYLNFAGETEEAFNFYKSVFGGEFMGEMARFSEMPPMEGQPALPENEKNWVLHVSLPILGGHLLMGSDVPSAMGGDKLVKGGNFYISLHPDTRVEADRLFAALSEGGTVEMPMTEEFWGDYFGSFKDRFGVQWMISTQSKD
ncbi:MAG TPA: VOC family protein [Thermomicrobiales bacterium]|nr:VOC family protein [Thermomicrobiales bacterium]